MPGECVGASQWNNSQCSGGCSGIRSKALNDLVNCSVASAGEDRFCCRCGIAGEFRSGSRPHRRGHFHNVSFARKSIANAANHQLSLASIPSGSGVVNQDATHAIILRCAFRVLIAAVHGETFFRTTGDNAETLDTIAS